jgi:hypothetical protein
MHILGLILIIWALSALASAHRALLAEQRRA